MRESLRRLPPAYVRGNYPNQSEESLPLPARNEQDQPFPFRENQEREGEDLPPYSKSDPLAEEEGREEGTNPIEADVRPAPPSPVHQYLISNPANRTLRNPDGEDNRRESTDQSRYQRDVLEYLWREAHQQSNENEEEEEELARRISLSRRNRTVALPHQNVDEERDLGSYASNVESSNLQKRRRSKKNLCCAFSKVCLAWWVFWGLMVIIPGVLAALKLI